jgi:tripartite-type tricarboxylate transporter receptor subunit TctC
MRLYIGIFRAKQGFDATGSTPEQLGTYVKEQVKVWHDAVKTAGIVPE